MSAPPDSARKCKASPSIAGRLTLSCGGLALSVALALCAAHWYEPPHLGGSVTQSIWAERDFLCSSASAVVAVAIGAWSSRLAKSTGAIASGSLFLRAVIWVAVTLPLLLAWADFIGLFALFVAPAQGLAVLRAIGLWSKWRTDTAWIRSR